MNGDGVTAQVLIVDDQRGVRNLLSDALAMVDVIAETLSNGKEAIERLTKNSYELVLLDLKMPGMGGLEVLKELKCRGISPCVWLMTAYDNLDLQRQASTLGVERQIAKPFDVIQLASDVRASIKARQLEKAMLLAKKTVQTTGQGKEDFPKQR